MRRLPALRKGLTHAALGLAALVGAGTLAAGSALADTTLNALFMKQAAYSEDDVRSMTKDFEAANPGIHVNLEGRVQFSEKAVDPPGDARADWSILRALSDVLGTPLPFDSFGQLRAQLFADFPAFAQPGLVSFPWAPPKLAAAKLAKGTAITYPIKDFYLTNPIARSSPTLQRCSAELLHGQDYAEAAE